jgi:hypothetical protein
MRPIGSLLTLIAAASLALAQAKPVSTPLIPNASAKAVAEHGAAKTGNPFATREPAAKFAVTQPAATTKTTGHKKPGAWKIATARMAKPARVASKPETAKDGAEHVTEVAIEPTPAPKPGTEAAMFKGKRDPFISIIRDGSNERNGCGTGKKCLVISDLTLKGVVRSGSDKFAVVENAARRTYFLREKDPVFNGQVVRITDNELIFRETVIDRIGRAIPREVVKKLPKG